MYENALRLNCACVRTVLVSELCLCQNSVCVRNCLHAMSGCRALNGLACRPGFCAGLVRLGGMKRDSVVSVGLTGAIMMFAVCFGGVMRSRTCGECAGGECGGCCAV